MPWTITKHEPSVIYCKFTNTKEAQAFLMSDAHWDNAKCDLKALARDMQRAVDADAPIFLFGDFFCAMQGKWDKRKDKTQLRPEHHEGNYLDKLVSTAADWLKPYASHIAVIAYGNHETSILNHHETDLIARLDERLRTSCPGYRGVVGAFAGFVRFIIHDGNRPVAKTLYWHHGYGGGGEVTRGMIDNNRTRSAAMADIFYSGHIHRRNCDENVILELDQVQPVMRQRRQLFLRGSCYKHEEGARDGNMTGWHVEKGRAARPIGGWLVHLKVVRPNMCRQVEISAEML